MIDYKKLEKVHALYPEGYLKIIPIFDRNGALYAMNYSMEIEGAMPDYFFEIDTLITTLEELVKQEPKFKLKQEVWFLHHENIEKGFIDTINTYNGCNIYHLITDDNEGFQIGEGLLFPTRQALIEHQLQYWQKLYNEALDDHGIYRPDIQLNESQDVDRCSHESDGNIYTSCPPQNKCIKCGEFYR